MNAQELPDRREGHLYRRLGPPPATAEGARLWERFYWLVERPAQDERPPLWAIGWIILPLLAGVAATWLSALLAQLFSGPTYSWPAFALALAPLLLVVLLWAWPTVRRLGAARALSADAADTVAGWSLFLCGLAAAAGAAAGQGLDNGVLLVLALVATATALLVVTGLAVRSSALYVAGMAVAWGVLILGAFIAVLALLRTGVCEVSQCVP
jgi:hypothetical protein